MKACLVGAYPPACGEASLNTYWTARGLAERGHQLLVVTDTLAGQPQCYLDESDAASDQPAFASGGGVRVFVAGHGHADQSDELGQGRAARLAHCAVQVIDESGCRVVAAAADEPYAAAGYLAARRAGRPLLIPAADAGRPVPAHVFHPDAEPLDPAGVVRLAAACAGRPDGRPWQPRARFDDALPCIGSYDEAGSLLSARRLLAALSSLRAAGLRVNALLMCDPARHGALWSAATAAGLGGSVWLLPVLPHWKLPGFIRRCTVVCCLGPVTRQIVAETLACGTCLVLPERSLASLPLGDHLTDGASAVVLPGSGDGPELAERLRALTGRPELAAGIGAGGMLCSRKFRTFSQFVDAWEARVGSMSGSARPQRQRPRGTRFDPDAGPDPMIEASVSAAARSCQGPGWLQFGLVPAPGRPLQNAEMYATMRAASFRLLDAGLAADFFFMHKPPGIRLRFRGAEGACPELGDCLRESLSGWERSGLIGGWRAGVYEPEEQLFGGPVSMRSVHRIFTADSLAWLGYHAAAGVAGSRAGQDNPGSPGPGWAMSLLLVRALLDALQIVGWEDRDVWDRLRRQAGRRLSPGMAARPELASLTSALKPAWSSPAALAALLSPSAARLAEAYRAAVLSEGKRWRADYLESGDAAVGARELAAFVTVFHWNRAGFSMARQALLTEALVASRPGAAR